ncbi:MAG: hypothetical protein AAGF54_02090 [Pseudomonadota bacterium]
MSFEELVALQPAWVQYWLNWLFFGAFLLPVALLIWKPSRIPAIVTLLSSLASGAGVIWLFSQMGYVRLLGLGHIIFWTPVSFYLYGQMKREDMPSWPKRIMAVVLITILISLAFDYVDVARYILGEREPFTG